MAEKKKKITELPLIQSLVGLYTLGVDAANNSGKVSLEWLKTAYDNVTAAISKADRATESANTAAGNANTAATDAGTAMAQITQDASEITTALSNFGEAAVAQETARVNSETARAEAETNRGTAEQARQTKETERQTAETGRANSETERLEAEQARATAETNRGTAETARQTKETARQTAETDRANAETARVEAETLRQTTSETAITHVNDAKEKAIEVAEHPTYIGEDMYIYEWNTTTKAYVKTTKYVKGDKGNPLTWADLTEEQKASLKGEAGSIEQGDAHNLTVSFTEATEVAPLNTGETLSVLWGKTKKWFTDLSAVAFSGSYNDLLNKPTIPAAQVQTDWNATEGIGVLLNKPTSLPASDVSAWAKAATKPTYTASEVGTYTTAQIDANFAGIDTILNNIIGE